MKIKSRNIAVRKVGDDGVFDFKGMSYYAADAVLRWYFSENSVDGPADDECYEVEDDTAAGVQHIEMQVLPKDIWDIKPIKMEDFLPIDIYVDGSTISHVNYVDELAYYNAIPMQILNAPAGIQRNIVQSFISAPATSVNEVKETVDAEKPVKMTAEQIFKAMNWL